MRVQSLFAHIDTCLPQNVLLHFSSTGRLTLEKHMQARRSPEEVLSVLADEETTSSSCQPDDQKRFNASSSDALADVEIQAFLFQPTEEPVVLKISQARLSPTFCADLFSVSC